MTSGRIALDQKTEPSPFWWGGSFNDIGFQILRSRPKFTRNTQAEFFVAFRRALGYNSRLGQSV